MTQVPQWGDNLRIAPIRFFSHLDDERSNVLIHTWPALLTKLVRRTILWAIVVSRILGKPEIIGVATFFYHAQTMSLWFDSATAMAPNAEWIRPDESLVG